MIHLSTSKSPALTLCGLSIATYRKKDGTIALRKVPLQVTNSVGHEECERCSRWDDARQIKQYAADCKAAGVKVGDL